MIHRPAWARCQGGHRHPGERDHLLLRDFLRASQSARVSCAGTKRAAAVSWRDDLCACTEAKTAVILDALKAAQTWALSCGGSVVSPSV